MKNSCVFILLSLTCMFLLPGCGSKNSGGEEEPIIEPPMDLTLSLDSVFFPAESATQNITVTSIIPWSVTSNQDWCRCSPGAGHAGQTILKVTGSANSTAIARRAILTFSAGSGARTCVVTQELRQEENYVPEAYSLVWQDEFNDAPSSNGKPAMPNLGRWNYETGNNGWGNNELQNYVAGVRGADTCAIVSNGSLKIMGKKIGNEILSIRMNTNQSWTYGYFEARLKLPHGKGTWPAFWMLPKNFGAWPEDGEIDIMEEVGYRPNYVLSTIHCKAYNHVAGTQQSGEKFISTAESDFHVYAVEWTPDYIWGFVDGERYFQFANDKKGDKNTWPFNVPFYIKLNLAWGGNWGGAQGVDETKLPITYEIDYVRVYQKK